MYVFYVDSKQMGVVGCTPYNGTYLFNYLVFTVRLRLRNRAQKIGKDKNKNGLLYMNNPVL